MTKEQHLSPFTATLININVMLGSGIFLNITELASRTGALGFLCYAFVGLLLLPLVASMAALLRLHPAGGFYAFGVHDLGPFFGFLNAWSYFVGKLSSATIMMHASVLIMQQLIPAFNTVSPFFIDTLILGFFVALNMLNMKTGSIIQGAFTTLKMIPIAFVILTGLFFLDTSNFSTTHQLWAGIPSSLPLVVYALIGFEVACSISNHIQNARVNAPRVIFLSYGIAVGIIILFQVLFYGMLGGSLAAQTSFRSAYPLLFSQILPYSGSVASILSAFCNLAIASSALGGAYGILFSNSWNLYTLAKHNHIVQSSWFTQFNRYSIPFACILAEGALCLFYLFVSGGRQVVLQQLGVLGVITSLSLSVFALAVAKRRHADITIPAWIPSLGLCNCFILIAACIRGLLITGPAALLSFIALLLLGSSMFLVKKYQNAQPSV